MTARVAAKNAAVNLTMANGFIMNLQMLRSGKRCGSFSRCALASCGYGIKQLIVKVHHIFSLRFVSLHCGCACFQRDAIIPLMAACRRDSSMAMIFCAASIFS